MFGTRAWHREVVDVLTGQISDQRETIQMLRRDLSALHDKYHQLKLHGAVEVSPPVIREPAAVDEVVRAVNLASRGNRGLRATMLDQVARDRQNGIADIEIVARIGKGNTDDSLESFADGVT